MGKRNRRRVKLVSVIPRSLVLSLTRSHAQNFVAGSDLGSAFPSFGASRLFRCISLLSVGFVTIETPFDGPSFFISFFFSFSLDGIQDTERTTGCDPEMREGTAVPRCPERWDALLGNRVYGQMDGNEHNT